MPLLVLVQEQELVEEAQEQDCDVRDGVVLVLEAQEPACDDVPLLQVLELVLVYGLLQGLALELACDLQLQLVLELEPEFELTCDLPQNGCDHNFVLG